MSTLFDVSEVEPGQRGRFAQDRYGPMRVTPAEWVANERGPAVDMFELADLIARTLSAWGVEVHSVDVDLGDLDGIPGLPQGFWAVCDVTLLAESQPHAVELFVGLFDRALDDLEKHGEWFEHNPAKNHRPGVT